MASTFLKWPVYYYLVSVQFSWQTLIEAKVGQQDVHRCRPTRWPPRWAIKMSIEVGQQDGRPDGPTRCPLRLANKMAAQMGKQDVL